MLERLKTAAVIVVVVSTICGMSKATTTHSESSLDYNDNSSSSNNGGTSRSTLLDNGLSRTLRHIYAQCGESEDFFWCTKVQATKLLGRALKVPNVNIIEGLTIVKKANVNNDDATREGRASADGSDRGGGANEFFNLSNRDIEKLSLKSLDALLYERFQRFVQSRQIQISLPRMLAFGQRNSQHLLQDIMSYITSLITGESSGSTLQADSASEAREKKYKDKKYLGPFVAVVMMKAAILKMMYHSIAIIAGKALIVGKIALIISAIIGLKKLVGQEGGEKTTYEIVKHPQVQQSHSYSSSQSNEYEGGHESGGGAYHRSIDDEMMMQDKAYHAWVPTTKIS